MDVPLIFFFNLVWNGFGSNFTGWVGNGAENLPHEDLYKTSYNTEIHKTSAEITGTLGVQSHTNQRGRDLSQQLKKYVTVNKRLVRVIHNKQTYGSALGFLSAIGGNLEINIV